MEFIEKIRRHLRLSSPLLLLFISLVDFLVYYIINGWFWQYDYAVYAAYFIGRLFEIVIPVLTAALLCTKARGVRGTLLWALLLTLPRLIYTLPYYYLRYVYDIYDSIEAITLALLMSAVVTVISALKVALLYYIIKFISRKRGAEPSEAQPMRILDLDNPAVFGTMCASLIIFVAEIATEIYDTVTFFLEHGTRYRTGEIIFMVGSYVFIIAALVITNITVPPTVNLMRRIRARFEEKNTPKNIQQ